MTRLATAVDRLAALIFGIGLILLGVGLLLWNTHWIPDTPDTITAPGLVTATETHWWPWAVAAAGVLLVLLALRWLFAHTPKTRLKGLRLSVGPGGDVTADLGQVADAAARALQASPDVHSAKGRAVVDRGVRTLDLTVTAYSPTTLAGLIEVVDAVNGQIANALGDSAVATRTLLHVDGKGRHDRVE
jgi:hypothetical protein